MALRFQSKGATVTQAGTTFTHGLTDSGVATAPDEWYVCLRRSNAEGVYVVGAPTTTTIRVAAVGASASADVFCSVTHSILGPFNYGVGDSGQQEELPGGEL